MKTSLYAHVTHASIVEVCPTSAGIVCRQCNLVPTPVTTTLGLEKHRAWWRWIVPCPTDMPDSDRTRVHDRLSLTPITPLTR
jgi:hypothetical protein